MATVKIKYYRVRKGRGYWISTKRMQALGLPKIIRCGVDGPNAWAIANEWNARWQAVRLGREPSPKNVWPRGSLGEGFEKFRRSETWKAKKERTREDWDRGWQHIAPIFGDVAPGTVTFEYLDGWYHNLKAAKSVQEAHRAMKIWRALWRVLASLKYCAADEDPSSVIRRETPQARSAIWQEGEVVRLVKEAWRQGYRGLACIIALAYDTQLAPVDARSLTLEDSRINGGKLWFELDRSKTGREAVGTLSLRTQALICAYVDTLPVELHPSAPIFRTRRGVPYRKNSLAEDFRAIRKIVLPGDKRQLQDMRRTGAVEAQSGGADLSVISQKMANTVASWQQLQKTIFR
jgi:integrase